MRFAGVVAPVHVVPRAIADGDAGRARSFAIACEAIVACASEEVTELVGIEVWAWSCTCSRDLGIVPDVAVVCEQSIAKVERRQLLHTTQREESINVIIGGFRCKCLAIGDAVVDLVVVDFHRLTPRFQVAN
eukprot:336216-Pleurochrysis_carterae.AAC.1